MRDEKLTATLAGLVMLAVPVGIVIPFRSDGSIGILAAQLAVGLLAFHLCVSELYLISRGDAPRRPPLFAAIALALTLAPAAFVSPDWFSGSYAYFNFATGTVGGILLGYVWSASRTNDLNAIDLCIGATLCICSIQLGLAFWEAPSVAALHQNSRVPWGNSNYVAGTLVVLGLAYFAQVRKSGRGIVYQVPSLLAFFAAIATFSRGATLALCVGVAVLLWTAPPTKLSQSLSRVLSIGTLALPLVLLDAVTSVRTRENSQADLNVDIRFSLYRLAWDQFLDAPLVGNGWLQFRESSSALGSTQSFAHNLPLSILQIAGIVGLPFLIVVFFSLVRGMFTSPHLAAALAASGIVALLDPFYEGTVGAAVCWALLIKANLAKKEGAVNERVAPGLGTR